MNAFLIQKNIYSNVSTVLEQTKSEITINNLVETILKNNSIIKRFKNDKTCEPSDLINKIFGFHFTQEVKLQDQLIFELVDEIDMCFNFNPPDLPYLNINYNYHKLDIKYADPVPIGKNEETTFPPLFFNLSLGDEYLCQNSQIFEEKTIKKVLFEAINELIIVYPALKEIQAAYDQCIDEMFNYLIESKDENQLKSIAWFKFACSQSADHMMNKNNFLK